MDFCLFIYEALVVKTGIYETHGEVDKKKEKY